MATLVREEFATRLNQERINQHLSLSAVARLAGVPKPTVQGWLNGRHLPTPALRPQFLQLVEALHLLPELPDGLWLEEWDRIEPHLRAGRAPYLGLRQFEAGDVELFRGRSGESRRLAQAVLDLKATDGCGVICLLGPSGSGKSSLLAAGLLGGQCVDGLLAGWAAEVSRADALSNPAPATDLLLVDQFEEVLLQEQAAKRPILDALATQAQQRIVVLAIRSDAFSLAEVEPVLAAPLARPVLVSPLTRAELREVIVEPAQLAGVAVDEDLVHILLSDLAPGSERVPITPDVLPLLSNALLLTWAAGAGERMTLADYRRVGGVSGAVELLAEQVFAELDTDQQEVAQRLFLRLIALAPSGVLRRSLRPADLEPDSTAVMDAFVAARMLTVTESRVQISHEVLLRHWTRLGEWIEQHRSDLEAVSRVHRAAELWRDTDRDPDALIPVERLLGTSEPVAEADNSLLGPLEREYLAVSADHHASELEAERRTSRRLRRQRRLALGLAVVATIAAGGAGFSYVRGEGFREQEALARAEAQSRQAAVQARSLRTKSPNLVAQMALVSDSLADTQEGRSVMLDADATDLPLRWTGKPDAVLALSADGTLVARADGAGAVTLWRGAELTAAPGTTFTADPQRGSLVAIALAQVSGRSLLAVGGANGGALWDVTGEPTSLAPLADGTAISALAFDAAGTRLAAGLPTGEVIVYDVASPERLTVARRVSQTAPDRQVNGVSSVALSPDGLLYVGGPEAGVSRWDLRSGKQLDALRTDVLEPAGPKVPTRVLSLGLSRDGTELSAGVAGNEVFRWRISGAEAEPLSSLTGFTSWINAVTYTADGTGIGVASSDQTVSVYDSATGSLARQMVTPAIQNGVGFSSEGRPVSVGADGALLVWLPRSPLWKQGGSVIYNLSTNGSGWLAGGSATDGIALWKLGTPDRRMPSPVVPELPAGDYQRGAATVAPSGKFLVGGTLKGRMLTWPLTDAGAGKGSVFETELPDSVIYAAITPDSSLVASMASGPGIAIYRADLSGQLTRLSEITQGLPQLITFDATGKLLAIAQADKSVELWSVADPATPVLAGTISGLESVPSTIDASSVSQRLAVGESSGAVSLWDITDPAAPKRERSWNDPASAMYSLEFSPDDRRLVGTSGDDLIWGWDLTSPGPSLMFALSGELGRPWDVRYLDTGRFAVSGNSGGVRVWAAEVGRARSELCQRLGTRLTELEWQRYLPGIASRSLC